MIVTACGVAVKNEIDGRTVLSQSVLRRLRKDHNWPRMDTDAHG
jgi:hypothetical protein